MTQSSGIEEADAPMKQADTKNMVDVNANRRGSSHLTAWRRESLGESCFARNQLKSEDSLAFCYVFRDKF
jgi:hypothetical protein